MFWPAIAQLLGQGRGVGGLLDQWGYVTGINVLRPSNDSGSHSRIGHSANTHQAHLTGRVPRLMMLIHGDSDSWKVPLMHTIYRESISCLNTRQHTHGEFKPAFNVTFNGNMCSSMTAPWCGAYLVRVPLVPMEAAIRGHLSSWQKLAQRGNPLPTSSGQQRKPLQTMAIRQAKTTPFKFLMANGYIQNHLISAALS